MSTCLLLTCGAIAPVLFILTFLVDGATRPGYDASRHFVSQLSTGDRGWLQIANFVLCGLLILAGAVGLWRAGISRSVAVVIGVIALGLIGAGVFVTDPGLGYPPGEPTPTRPTSRDAIHGLMSVLVFLPLGVVPLVVALREARSRLWAAYSAISGPAVLVFIFAAATAAAEGLRIGSAAAPAGVLQRISIAAGFVWLSAFFLRSRSVNAR